MQIFSRRAVKFLAWESDFCGEEVIDSGGAEGGNFSVFGFEVRDVEVEGGESLSDCDLFIKLRKGYYNILHNFLVEILDSASGGKRNILSSRVA